MAKFFLKNPPFFAESELAQTTFPLLVEDTPYWRIVICHVHPTIIVEADLEKDLL